MASDGSLWAQLNVAVSDQQIAEHDAALIDWAKTKLAEVDAATRGSSSLPQFLSRATAEFYAIEDAASADLSDSVLSARVRDFYKAGGFFPTGRVGSLFALLRPSRGDSRCRMLCKAAKDESASEPRAVTIDAKIQSLWDAIQAVLNSAFARAQNEPHDDLALERFCNSWDALRDYIPRPKANEGSMGALSNDNRTNEILNLLRDTPDQEAGIPIAELPAQLRNEGLFTEWLAADLIEVIQRNHCHTGGGPRRKLVLENGWSVTELSKPNRKRVWQLLQEALGKDTEPEIRLRVRLGRAGDVEIARLRGNSVAMPAATDKPQGDSLLAPVPAPFRGGEMVFQRDRVVFCGVDICSGPRCQSRRAVLELLAKRRQDGSFVAYSGEDLEAQAKGKGADGTASRWIRDLRYNIVERLRDQANIECDHKDVILSGGPGYRFADSVTIQFEDTPSNKDITDISDTDEATDVPNDDVRDDASGTRRAWILQELGNERRLKAPDVAAQFSCSVKTAQRDLTALKDEGLIEFVGTPRTGYYRLCRPANSSSSASE